MLTFNPLFPLPILCLLSISLITYTCYSYRKTPKHILTLRLLSILCVTFIIMQPAIVSKQLSKQKDKLYLLTDTSASMDIKDMPGATSRHKALHASMNLNKELLKQLEEVYELRKLNFASDLSKSLKPKLSKRYSAIGTALSKTAQDSQIQKVKGILLFSDGINNSGTSLNKAISTLNKKNIPVHTFTLGQDRFQGEIVDGKMLNFSCPQSIKRKNSLQLKTEFSLKGLKGRNAVLEILIEDKVTKTLVINANKEEQNFQQTLSVETTELKTGYHKITARLITGDNELSPVNNYIDNYFQVTEGSLKVLLLATSPSPEFKFMNRILSSYEDIDCQAPNPFYVRTEAGQNYLKSLNLDEYDLFIFQNPDFKILSKEFLKKCQTTIQNRRHSLIFSGASINNKFSELNIFNDFTFTDSTNTNLTRLQQHPTLTKDGENHFVTAFLKGNDLNQWPTLDGVSSQNKLTPGVTCLLKVGDTPLLSTLIHNKNRVAWLNTNAFWQLMNHDLSREDYKKLWLRLLYYLTSRENTLAKKLSLFSEKTRYLAGKPFLLEADLLDSKSLPITNAEVFIHSNELNSYPIKSTHSPKTKLYNHETSILHEGLYTFKAKTTLAGQQLTSNEVKIFIQEPRVEYNRVLSDKTLMTNIANATNGESLQLDELPKLLEELIQNAQVRTVSTVSSNQDLWDNIYIYLLIALLLCVEWQLRRSQGLL